MYNYRTKALKILIWAFFRRNSYSDLRCSWSADTFCWQNLFNYLSIRYQEKKVSSYIWFIKTKRGMQMKKDKSFI